jgi:hypothetical protein
MNNTKLPRIVRSIMLLACCMLMLGGCKHRPGIVRVIVHGPVVTVPTKAGTTIVVPRSDLHLTASPYPKLPPGADSNACTETSVFELTGVQSAGEETTIDPAFSPVIFKVSDWKPLGKADDYSITMHLPTPRAIDALGPLYDVRFTSNPAEPARVPLTQILEFDVRDVTKMRLVRTVTARCGSSEPTRRIDVITPLSCAGMRKKYEEYFRSIPDVAVTEQNSQRPFIEHELKRCSADTFYLFVGVGLDPRTSHSQLEAHGLDFFNNKLLPEIYGGQKNIPPGKKLIEKGLAMPGYGTDHGEGGPRVIPTSFGGERPLYVPVAMTENCTAPGTIVRTGN